LAAALKVLSDEVLVVDSGSCRRCLGSHGPMAFRRLRRSIGKWTYWAECPVTKEPLLATAGGPPGVPAATVVPDVPVGDDRGAAGEEREGRAVPVGAV
jgi:hypothetical protein